MSTHHSLHFAANDEEKYETETEIAGATSEEWYVSLTQLHDLDRCADSITHYAFL
jgi:hypothetical protein